MLPTINTRALTCDLRARVVNRPQITSDGWPAYPDAITEAFGREVDFATIVKVATLHAVEQRIVEEAREPPGRIALHSGRARVAANRHGLFR
jgi:hypothetical protein